MDFGKELVTYLTFFSIITPLVVKAIRQTGVIRKRWSNLLSIGVGVLLGLLSIWLPGAASPAVMAWAGGLSGLGGNFLLQLYQK
ncbi:Phage holin [Listeria grayi]|uniref:Phage holin n=1 Tax=Listeria grayi DSM 20601 TaxID=525367 RepID=D7UUW0_LISGR|nr:holin [Listeria grayi]EFI85036.1 phage holin [Listeria grayi DSM 20601]MBC1922014.1 holin [Listeria grayi]VEI30434.1 Phage holin [Listeria grayi]